MTLCSMTRCSNDARPRPALAWSSSALPDVTPDPSGTSSEIVVDSHERLAEQVGPQRGRGGAQLERADLGQRRDERGEPIAIDLAAVADAGPGGHRAEAAGEPLEDHGGHVRLLVPGVDAAERVAREVPQHELRQPGVARDLAE